MPTTVYDSSSITARLRDKAIANEMQKRNAVSAPIIIPQASYGSYVVENKDNGAITSYTDNNGCYIIDKGCACVLTAQVGVTPIPLGTDNFDITHEILSEVMLKMTNSVKYKKLQLLRGPSPTIGILGVNQYRITLKGIGIINWGDGSPAESFDFPIDTDITHIYDSTGTYTINVRGTIYTLQVSNKPRSGDIIAYPNVTSIVVNSNENLTTLVARNSNLTTITNFDKLNTLIELYFGLNQVDIAPIYGFSNLQVLDLSEKPGIVGDFDCSGLSSQLYLLDLYNIYGLTDIINVSSISASLTNLNLNLSGINNFSNIALLTNLTYLDIGLTSITDITGISALTTLETLTINNLSISTGFSEISFLFNTLTFLNASAANIDDTNFLSIKDLINLTYLSIENNPVTNISGIDVLSQLTELDIATTNIITGFSDIYNITSLINLYISSTGQTNISGINTLTNLTILQFNYNPTLTGLLDISGLINLTILNGSNTGITGIDGTPLPLITDTLKDINLSDCNIDQTAADNIAETIYNNGTVGGYLGIASQTGGPLTITGGYWDLLVNTRSWFVY